MRKLLLALSYQKLSRAAIRKRAYISIPDSRELALSNLFAIHANDLRE